MAIRCFDVGCLVGDVTIARKMNILVTGASGFVGRNLVGALREKALRESDSEIQIFEYNRTSSLEELDECCQKAHFVFNLAGVNRPTDQADFRHGKVDFLATLLDTLKRHDNRCPVMRASSTQALLDNPYGHSKAAAEKLLTAYGKSSGARVLIYRFSNIFGRWSRANYNSVVATFCHNIARGIEIEVNDKNHPMQLLYIDDVVQEMIAALSGEEHRKGDFCIVPTLYRATLGEIAEMIYSFKRQEDNNLKPSLSTPFERALYATYLSHCDKATEAAER